jgi:predicted DNA-binding transcriptional regulator AlpA
MKLLILKEAADRLGFSAQTLYNVEAFLELFP